MAFLMLMRPRCTRFQSDTPRKFPPHRRYLIAVSGGSDSVSLLHWLVELGYRKLIVCHLDHQLRGRSSQADARLVKELAAKYDVSFESGLANVRALAKRKNVSIETAAREARYAFFADVARRRRCRTIFLAHHADDLVETFLFNLFRGTGGSGRVMRTTTEHKVGKTTLTVVRPFLAVWRAEIDAYVHERGLGYREDTSNAELASARNRIRH